MKKIDSFEEFCNLPFGSIVCFEAGNWPHHSKNTKGFAMVTDGNIDVGNGGIHPKIRKSDGTRGFFCGFVTEPDTILTFEVFPDSFSSYEFYVFEPLDLAKLWGNLTHTWADPEYSRNDILKALLFGVMHFHPKRGKLSCTCVPAKKFAQFNTAKDSETAVASP